MAYEWAANPAKVERAIKELKDKNKPVTEEAVKAIYVRLAGKVIEKSPSDVAAEEVSLEKMKKDDLVELAEKKGIAHDGLSKDELINAIKAAE